MTSRKVKDSAASSKTPRRRRQQQMWPRPEGQPFELPPHLHPRNFLRKSSHHIPGYTERRTLTEWCDYHSVFYNGLLNVAMEPTRTLDREMLAEMGIVESTDQLFQNLQFGTMPYADYDLYPDLVRQFLATLEVEEVHENSTGDTGYFFFFCNGQRYRLDFSDIGMIYGWDTVRWDRAYSQRTLGKMESFWEAIAHGDFDSADLKIARIRNPTLRIAAKLLAQTFFCREQPDRINKSALVFLFTGLNTELRTLLTFGSAPMLTRINLSRMFLDVLADRKYRGLGPSAAARVESVGSLITPILMEAGVDLRRATVDTRRLRMDRAYLAHTRILRQGVYHWITADGMSRYCTLPRPEWSAISTVDQLRFMVPGWVQCTSDGKVLPEFDTNPDPLQTILGDAPVRFCPHGNPLCDPVPLTEDLPDTFYASVPPLPGGASRDDWQLHRDRVQGQQTTILRGIVGALTHLTWTPPAPCCSATPDAQQD